MMADEIRIGGSTFRIEAAQFGPSDLEKVSGMPKQIARLWRSRGLLPDHPRGRATYGTREVAEIMVRFDLSRLGVPPSVSREIAANAAQIVLWFALLNSDGACEVKGDESDVELFLAAFNRNEKVVDSISGTSDAFQFLVAFPSSEPEFATQIDNLFQSKSARAAMVIDLSQVALDLSEKVGRPLFSISSSCEAERMVRRLTGHRPLHVRLVT